MTQVALVTGAAQGIGKAIAKHFLEQNIKVVVADSDKQAGKETVKEFSPFGDLTFVPTQISNEADVKNLIRSVIKTHGRLDYLINNAGIMVRKPIEKLSLKEWNDVIGVNLTGVFLCCKYAAPFLKKTKGAIINIASTRALMSEPNTESYSASKGGIVALTHALAMSLGPDVRVNSISPGWIEVDDWKKSSKRHTPKHTQADLDQHPVGRVGRPEDIASLAFYLASFQAGFITGENFVVDGGMTHKMIYV
ncbi:MAG: SDR family oxidoreductase [Gammaproteobacteria bacterium]|nr:SDR family oxidoreductase [Gammaproteobacteria bacterium]